MNVTESNEQMNIRTKERKGKSYIPLGIYAEGIIRPLVQKEMSFKGFSFFSSGSHFVQRSVKFLAILVGDHSRNISVKLF